MRHQALRLLRKLLNRHGLNLIRTPNVLLNHPEAEVTVEFKFIFAHFLTICPQPWVVQIGAFNGKDGDPLYEFVSKHLFQCLLLEPQHDAFRALAETYHALPNVRLVNAAVSARTGTTRMFRVRSDVNGPRWLGQLSSFNRSVLMNVVSDIPGGEASIVTEEVATITFDDLLVGSDRTPDVLVIDTEGYDYELIKLYDVPRRLPSIIHYEHKHLSPRDRSDCVELLVRSGYKVGIGKGDTTACRYLK